MLTDKIKKIVHCLYIYICLYMNFKRIRHYWFMNDRALIQRPKIFIFSTRVRHSIKIIQLLELTRIPITLMKIYFRYSIFKKLNALYFILKTVKKFNEVDKWPTHDLRNHWQLETEKKIWTFVSVSRRT